MKDVSGGGLSPVSQYLNKTKNKTMSIEEKSKLYANGKALDAITKAIERAYFDGYNDGLKHLENKRLEEVKEGVVYKDLGLSSGKLWSSHYIRDSRHENKMLPYIEASKLNIPSKEDYEELCRECRIEFCLSDDTLCPATKFIGRTGEEIVIDSIEFKPFCRRRNDNDFIFWLKDNINNDEKITASIKQSGEKSIPEYHKVFMGLPLPIMLVKEQ